MRDAPLPACGSQMQGGVVCVCVCRRVGVGALHKTAEDAANVVRQDVLQQQLVMRRARVR